jgi:beta-glucosidase
MFSRNLSLAVAAALLAGSALAAPSSDAPGAPASAPERGVAHPAAWPAAHSRGLVDARTEAQVTALMARLSLEEKIGQMIQADISSIKPEDLRQYPLGSILAGGNTPPLSGDLRAPAQAWIDTARAFRAVSTEARPGHTPIPIMFGIDAVHGDSHVFGATVFPHNIALGATHDPDLIRRIGVATGQETAAAGIDWAFGPTLATPRDHRWGRTYEGYSEDPEIVRAYAGQIVRGLQGEPGAGHALQNGHVAASAKHFLGDGGTTNGADQGDTDVSEAELIAVHAQGYPAAIDAGVMTVMASYSSWQGHKMHGNAGLLTGVLKGRMGFDGFVVSDWNGHGQLPGCTNENCPAAINAGVDLIMAPDSWKGLYKTMLAQARSGEIPASRIDDAVRRILRVKIKLGLLDPSRPWEGRPGVLGSPDHRALARQAVRESLVLLKNNGGVLPIRVSAHILVTGSGADDIGRQSGGWTLSWQGTGNTNRDFPGAQSIYAGLKAAAAEAGGSAELSADGSFVAKPDVAVVVFGESPYAEFQGDIRTLDYQAGDRRDLALLKRLKAQGVPVVSVFLSGRPLWVNPEINASDAFVAAWLPGSEGEGIADLLVGDAAGKPRHDFTGKLAYSWPKSAAQTRLNRGQTPYDPLFAYGFGLTYADHAVLPPLSEDSGVSAADSNIDRYFVSGHTPPPWRFVLIAAGQSIDAATDGRVTDAGGVVSIRPVDAGGVQEGGRAFVWTGKGEGVIALTGPALDLARQANGDVTLVIDYRVEQKPSGRVSLGQGCGGVCAGAVDIGPILTGAPIGEWRTLKVKLACFRDAGTDLAKLTQPFVMTTAGKLSLSLRTVRLSSDPAGAVCPAKGGIG